MTHAVFAGDGRDGTHGNGTKSAILDYILVSWPRPGGLAAPLRCWVTGDELIDGVQASDHFAVVADLRTPA